MLVAEKHGDGFRLPYEGIEEPGVVAGHVAVPVRPVRVRRDVGEDEFSCFRLGQFSFKPLALSGWPDVLAAEVPDVVPSSTGGADADETAAFVHERVVVRGFTVDLEVLREEVPDLLLSLTRFVVSRDDMERERDLVQVFSEFPQMDVPDDEDEVGSVVCTKGLHG